MPPNEQKSTTGVVRYLKRPPPGQHLFTYLYEVPVGVAKPSNLGGQHISFDVFQVVLLACLASLTSPSSTDAELIDTEVSLEDLHSVAPQPSLERNGIKLVQFELPLNIDWRSDSQASKQGTRFCCLPTALANNTHGIHVQIQARVIPLVKDMLKRETGAARVVVCDHTVRRGTVEYATMCLFSPAPCMALWSNLAH